MYNPTRQNIQTIRNPFTTKDYDIQGNEVKELNWRYYEKTGDSITIDEVRSYVNLTPKGKWKELEKIWIDWCNSFLKKNKDVE
jgi:hypothetical protein